MRIMLDTNILFSTFLFPNGSVAKILRDCVLKNYELVISSYSLDELKEILLRKAPEYMSSLNDFLGQFEFTYVYVPAHLPKGKFKIRDENDYPILYAAMVENVDLLLTGDKDLLEAEDVLHPRIISPKDFRIGFLNQDIE